MRLNSKERRAITQKIDARVVSQHDDRHGIVTGHYDDDSVFVLFDGEQQPEQVCTESLRLEGA